MSNRLDTERREYEAKIEREEKLAEIAEIKSIKEGARSFQALVRNKNYGILKAWALTQLAQEETALRAEHQPNESLEQYALRMSSAQKGVNLYEGLLGFGKGITERAKMLGGENGREDV